MSLSVTNVLLSVPDGLVQSEDRLWLHFQKYPWNLNCSNNPGPGEHRRRIEARLLKGLPNPQNAKQIEGTFFLGISPHINSYYHFISELLPQLIQETPFPVLMPEMTPSTFSEFLNNIGYPVQQLQAGNYLVEKLLIPDIDKIDWSHKKVQSLQYFMQEQVPKASNGNTFLNKYSSRIFISRKLAGRRHLANEEELLPILEKHGFQRVFLENISIMEQVQLMRQATHVVAAHGAGMVNLLFAPTDVRILEIRPTLSSGQYCFDRMLRKGWPHHEILIPPKKGRFELPPKYLENILEKWANNTHFKSC